MKILLVYVTETEIEIEIYYKHIYHVWEGYLRRETKHFPSRWAR